MKTIKIIGLFLASVIAGSGFTGCKGDTYESRIKELILKDMSFPSSASSAVQTFRLEDLSHYKISSNSAWCKAKIQKDSCLIRVNVDENTSYDQRVAVVTLSDVIDTTQTRTFNVTQAQLDALLITEDHLTVATAGGQVTIPVQTNISYSVKIDDNDADWISLSLSQDAKTRALKDTSVVLNIAKNDSYDNRTGYVYVVSDKDPNVKVKITIDQQFEAVLNVDPLVLSIDELGGVVKVTVKTNIAYDVHPQDDWISKSGTKQENDTVFTESFRVESFTEKKKTRTGYVIIENPAWDDLQKKIKITQTRALYIENDVSVSAGSALKVELVNNTGDDDITWESSDVKVATVTSDGNVQGVSEGTATLKVTSSDGEHTYSVKITVTKAPEEESGGDKKE